MLTYIILAVVLATLLALIFLHRAKRLRIISSQLPKAVRKRAQAAAKDQRRAPSKAPAILSTPRPAPRKPSQNATALFRKAEQHLQRGNFEEAEKLFVQVLAEDPKHLDTHEQLGKLYVMQGNLVKGEGAYRAVLSFEPNRRSAYLGLGTSLVKQEKFPEAVVAYEKACELHQGDPLAWDILSAIFERMEHFERAAAAMEKAVEHDPAHMERLQRLWDLYQRIDAPTEKIKDVLRRILEIDPDHAQARERLNILMRMGE